MPPDPVDPGLGRRWRNQARVLRAERAMNAAVKTAMTRLFAIARTALRTAGMDPAVLDTRDPRWRAIVEEDLLPEIEEIFTGAFDATSRGVIDPSAYATRYLEARTNMVAGIAEEVFDAIRVELASGREAHESIPELADRVDELLLGAGAERWKNRAVTIARTETIGANEAGGYDSARASTALLGVDPALVVKVWLSTSDSRTREDHEPGKIEPVRGLQTPFVVGGSLMQFSHDPAGPAAQIINCRCTTLYHYPGDPGYDSLIAAAAPRQENPMSQFTTDSPEVEISTGMVIVALPAASDPIHGIGPEDKHATLLWFGNADATDDLGNTTALLQLVAEAVAAETSPFTAATQGTERLGDDDPQALVLRVTGDDLGPLRDALLAEDPEVQSLWESVKQWPRFTPHVTLGYPETEADATEWTDAAAAVESISFDRIAVWIGDNRTEYPLGAAAEDTDEEENEMPEDALAAAAGDAVPALTPASTHDAGEPAPAVSLDATEDTGDDRFHGVAMVENVQTGDGRAFAPGAIEWDGLLPMPVGWQVEDAPGHDGAIICGRIDTMERQGNLIRYEGTWDLEGVGYETRRLVEGQFLRGISVDVDDADGVMIDSDGNEVDPMDAMFEDPGDVLWVTTRGRIRSAALCRVPAFAPIDSPDSVFVANGTWADAEAAPAEDAEPVEEQPVEALTPEEVTAALVAAAVELDLPPRQELHPVADYLDPGLDGPTPVTVTADGRIYGHVAQWGTCHIGVQGRCVTPPKSETGYAHYLFGETLTADAGIIPTGKITMGTGHAAPNVGMLAAVEHYDNTGTIVASVGAGEDEHGIWINGWVSPWASDEQLTQLRAAGALSGDWRRIGGNLELVAALVVNVPGFPIPRVSMAASAGAQQSLVASGIVAPMRLSTARRIESGEIDVDALTAAVEQRISRNRRLSVAEERLNQAADRRRAERLAAAAARIGG